MRAAVGSRIYLAAHERTKGAKSPAVPAPVLVAEFRRMPPNGSEVQFALAMDDGYRADSGSFFGDLFQPLSCVAKALTALWPARQSSSEPTIGT
jgi:hypothetical protein